MKTGLRLPYQRAIITISGLTVFSLLTTLVMWGFSSIGLVHAVLTWISLFFFILMGLILVIIWLMALYQAGRIRAFLESDRPLVRWTYSSAEWMQYKEVIWKEESGDWKIQWGCLTFLLGLAGLLTGIMLGFEDGFLEVIINGFMGLLLGSLSGATLGALVAGGNYWGARQAYRQAEPGQVALAPNEIYANDDYFKGDGQSGYIREAKIQRGNPTILELQLVVPPRPRTPSEEEWLILIPSQWIERVEDILPGLMESI